MSDDNEENERSLTETWQAFVQVLGPFVRNTIFYVMFLAVANGVLGVDFVWKSARKLWNQITGPSEGFAALLDYTKMSEDLVMFLGGIITPILGKASGFVLSAEALLIRIGDSDVMGFVMLDGTIPALFYPCLLVGLAFWIKPLPAFSGMVVYVFIL